MYSTVSEGYPDSYVPRRNQTYDAAGSSGGLSQEYADEGEASGTSAGRSQSMRERCESGCHIQQGDQRDMRLYNGYLEVSTKGSIREVEARLPDL